MRLAVGRLAPNGSERKSQEQNGQGAFTFTEIQAFSHPTGGGCDPVHLTYTGIIHTYGSGMGRQGTPQSVTVAHDGVGVESHPGIAHTKRWEEAGDTDQDASYELRLIQLRGTSQRAAGWAGRARSKVVHA